jgi:hypothetical protein
VRTRHLSLVTHEHSDTTRVRSNVCSPYGPVNPASTTLLAQETLRANQLAQLSELLNSLESVVESLNYKSYTVIRYLGHRYRGSACRALAHSDRRGWY